ncbi:hypothetical protein [Mycobacterium sp. Aquia_213]|uniref:hypothetical protein n=1 Tax=Mycobacterium sp. Aquia_213 TaxID=2991728 RepID=UPI00227041C6|nr:hypothetical protein [Mycobacterium sp. Aquia_213]WAC92241.1 hypothetical protein LMQ14_03265 [Mycobacterium sp. Aquia_213]
MEDDQTSSAAQVPSQALRELEDGLAFWDSRRAWGHDLGNADYEAWANENPRGAFTLDWWKPFLGRLNRWRATRGPDSGEVLTSRFMSCAADLGRAWADSCEPFIDVDITAVNWDQVSAFPTLVATIKPTRSRSPVFASKFCHFLLPRVFPVVDNEGLGNRWLTYEKYFRHVQDEWASTNEADRSAMIMAITDRIEKTGATVFSGYPYATKLVELRLIGRQHPSWDRPTLTS